jgi:hypothetical protein
VPRLSGQTLGYPETQGGAQERGQVGSRVQAAGPGAADTERHENLCRHDDRKAVSSDIMMKCMPKEMRFVAEQTIKYVPTSCGG